MVVINFYKNFIEYGGAEKVALEVHKGLSDSGHESYVMGLNSFDENNKKYNIHKSSYKQFTVFNFFKLRRTTILSHHRRTTTILYVLNFIFHLKIRLIHVAHNEFCNLKYCSFYPKEIIAVSQRVKENLVTFFKINSKNITVIYNGMPDLFDSRKTVSAVEDKIKILYAARITKIKGQIDLVRQFEGKLNTNVLIDFAGIGEEYDELLNLTTTSSNFTCLGFVDLAVELYKYDYVMLFSSNEGLPLTLIEACSFKKPIICNDVGGNIEIVSNGLNGFVMGDYVELLHLLNNKLEKIDRNEYEAICENSRKIYEEKFLTESFRLSYVKYIEKSTDEN
jgi:glycosyltransferase involved in cell wall biosynthesis